MSILVADVIDISKWQYDRVTVPPRQINFDLLASKVRAVICKCGQGNYLDYAFEMYMRELKKRGVPRGSYWFYDNRFDAKAQAQKYSELIREYAPDLELPCFVDYEYDHPQGKPSRLQDVYDFIVEFQKLEPNRKVGIYTGYYFWTASARFSGMRAGSPQLEWSKKFPLWLAWYTHDNTRDDVPIIPEPWDDWILWQFSDRGDGFAHGLHSKELDLNVTSEHIYSWLRDWSTDTVITPPNQGQRKIIFPGGAIYKEQI